MGPRILVLSTAAGAGHIRAAEAVELAVRQAAPTACVQRADLMSLTNRLFRYAYAGSYIDMVNKAPNLYGYFYDLLDRQPPEKTSLSDRFRRRMQWANLGDVQKLVLGQHWDLIINTHFLPAELIAELRRAGKLTTPHVTVTTDLEIHRLWYHQPCERYFTATEEATLTLRGLGVAAADIVQTGIPIHPVFSEPKERAVMAAKHDLDASRPIVLQLAGGHGVGPVEVLFRELLKVELPLQVVLVAGRNEPLRKRLQSLPSHQYHRVKILGFTQEIDELMAAADLVVSKPGGLTTSESLAREAVMVIVNTIPGQESRNSDYLLENGAAIKVNNPATLAAKVTALLNDRERLERLRANVRRIARPRAAFDVARGALAVLGIESSV
jgi:processive 1,2-diacylglycerol beta-glucosyltransferase